MHNNEGFNIALENPEDETFTCTLCQNGGFCPKHSKRDGVVPKHLYVADKVGNTQIDEAWGPKEWAKFAEDEAKRLGL